MSHSKTATGFVLFVANPLDMSFGSSTTLLCQDRARVLAFARSKSAKKISLCPEAAYAEISSSGHLIPQLIICPLGQFPSAVCSVLLCRRLPRLTAAPCWWCWRRRRRLLLLSLRSRKPRSKRERERERGSVLRLEGQCKTVCVYVRWESLAVGGDASAGREERENPSNMHSFMCVILR